MALFTKLGVALSLSLAAAAHGGFGECCQPWDNGRYDGRNAQVSQTGYGEDWREYGRVTADDFWLCEGSVYKINTIRGVLITDSAVPKADIIILADCDGLPGERVAHAYSVAPDLTAPDAEHPCTVGQVSITETGQTTPDGHRLIEVTATFDGLWLKGGAYWVSIVGFSGTADPDDEFFWGTSGGQVVKGRPGHFYDSTLGEPEWVPIDEVCCGCTDFNFCIIGDECKILLDNGGPDLTRAAASINNNNSLAQDARAADDIVVGPCVDREVCFFEGYLFTNCDPPRARLDVYDNDCKLPATFSPPISFEPSCIFWTGQTVTIGGRELRVYKVQFWDFRVAPGFNLTLQQNKNYWFSLYALGTGAQSQRGYFAGTYRCDLLCDGRTGHFNQAAVSGRGVGLPSAIWKPVDEIYSVPFDLAFLVAVRPEVRAVPGDDGPPVATCAPDINRDGVVTMQDLFDYLGAFFAGCP